MSFTQREINNFSLSRAIRGAADGGLKSGLEGEMLQEATEQEGRHFTPHSFIVPWGLINGARNITGPVATRGGPPESMGRQTRDFTVSGAGGMVGTGTGQPVDLLRPVSLAVQAGVQVRPGQQQSISVPKVSAGATGQWLTSELDPLVASDPTIGELSSTPHYAGALTVVSHLMGQQSIDDDFIGDHLLSLVGATLDAAVLNGSGASGEPQGILGMTDVQTVTGTSLALADLTEMEQLSAEANAQPSGYLTTPAVRKLLKDREAATGSGFIWAGDTVNGLPGYATTSAPAATMYLGPWDQVYVPLWGNGLELAVDPSTFFNTGKYQFRVLVAADVIVRHPAAFVTASSIT